jgi:hypothetical protein
MASSDFTNVLVKDSRLAAITDSLTYAVQSGASSNTYQSFPAVSSSNSQLSFQVQVPSENVVVSREVMLRATLNFTMEYTPGVAKGFAPNLCADTALSPFPLNQLFVTATAQINNTSVSSNIQDILPIILQLTDQREVSCYNATTPALLDTFYARFPDTLTGFHGTSSYNRNAGTNPRTGEAHQTEALLLPNINSPLAGYSNQSLDSPYQPRGSFHLKVVSMKRTDSANANAANEAVTATDSEKFWIAFEAEVCEPIIGLSPFIYGDNQFNKAGLVGVNSMNFVFNIDSTLSRLMGTAIGGSTTTTDAKRKILSPGWSTNTGATASTQLFAKAELLLNFLSSQPTDLIPARNVVPYMDLPRYITQKGASAIAAATENAAGATGAAGLIPTRVNNIVSNSIQLSQLPDYFIIAVRPSRTSTGGGVFNNSSGCAQVNAPHFLAIRSISVNLNNTSGLLSSATPQDLYRISVKNHSKQTWSQFNGHAIVGAGQRGIDTAVSIIPARLGFKDVPTTGSILVLNPAMDLSLPDYLSSGSLGAFNFQFTLTIDSYLDYIADAEIVVICANSGIFTTIAGSSNIYTGILTKSMVLDAKKEGAQDAIQSAQYTRLVGGQMGNNAEAKDVPLVKEFAKMAMKKRGMGVTGGGTTGGGYTGGKFSHLIH